MCTLCIDLIDIILSFTAYVIFSMIMNYSFTPLLVAVPLLQH